MSGIVSGILGGDDPKKITIGSYVKIYFVAILIVGGFIAYMTFNQDITIQQSPTGAVVYEPNQPSNSEPLNETSLQQQTKELKWYEKILPSEKK